MEGSREYSRLVEKQRERELLKSKAVSVEASAEDEWESVKEKHVRREPKPEIIDKVLGFPFRLDSTLI
jgi:hypothetical protein